MPCPLPLVEGKCSKRHCVNSCPGRVGAHKGWWPGTQGVVWNINPFDQFGVQLGKVLAEKILPSLAKDAPLPQTDSSTAALLRRYRGVR